MSRQFFSGFVLGALLWVGIGTPAFGFERYYLLKISKTDGRVEYRVLDKAGHKAYKDEVRQKGKYFSRARSLAKNKWRKDPDVYPGTFPNLTTEKFQVKGQFDSQAEAAAKMTVYTERESIQKESDEAEFVAKAKKKYKAAGGATEKQKLQMKSRYDAAIREGAQDRQKIGTASGLVDAAINEFKKKAAEVPSDARGLAPTPKSSLVQPAPKEALPDPPKKVARVPAPAAAKVVEPKVVESAVAEPVTVEAPVAQLVAEVVLPEGAKTYTLKGVLNAGLDAPYFLPDSEQLDGRPMWAIDIPETQAAQHAEVSTAGAHLELSFAGTEEDKVGGTQLKITLLRLDSLTVLP